jgi:hypothetical protein
MPLQDNTAAYGALLGALSTPGEYADQRKSAAAPAGSKRMRDDAQTAGGAEKLERRSVTAISGVTAHQIGNNEKARRAAVKNENSKSAQRKPGTSGAARKASEQTDEPLKLAAAGRAAASAQDGRLGAAAEVAQGPAGANSNNSGAGSGWRLSLPEEVTEHGHRSAEVQPDDDAAVDDAAAQDFFQAHFERCPTSHSS